MLDSRGEAPGGTQAIGRAMAVLDALVGGELGVSELAGRLDLRVPTTHRILRGLVESGFVTQSPVNDRYRLGWAAILFGRAAGAQHGLDEVDVALRGLAAAIGATASFNVRGPDCGLVLAAVTADGSAPDSAPGATASFYASAAGKALLAWSRPTQPVPPERAALVELVESLGPRDRFTDQTLTDAGPLADELAAIVARGYATDERESAPRCQGVAAPVLDDRGIARAAVAVVDPAGLTARQRDRARRRVMAVASDLAAVLPLDQF